MPLPQLAKSWQFDVNQIYLLGVDALATSRGILHGIKESLVTRLGARPQVTGPWSVSQSSNGTDVGESDLWAADTDLNWGTANHSWIVLAQPGISTNFEICIDLLGGVGAITVVWAPNGFTTAGTAAARPTAATEVTLMSSSGGGSGPPSQFIVHAMQSTDGQCTRVVAYSSNTQGLFWIFDKPRNPVANWSIPAAVAATDAGTTYATLQTPSSPVLRGYRNAPMGLYMSTESFGASLSAVGTQFIGANDFDGNWPLSPIGIACLDSGQRGRHGELFDLWFGSAGANDGDTYPGDGTRQFAQFGDLVLPWDGTTTDPGSVPLTT